MLANARMQNIVQIFIKRFIKVRKEKKLQLQKELGQ